MMRCLAWLLLFSQAAPGLAEPASPYAAPGIILDDFGIYCAVPDAEEVDAPDTMSGKIGIMAHSPEFIYRQQQIPALLGTSFGVAIIAPRDIPDTTVRTWIPGSDAPDTWASSTPANESTVRGFTFDYPHEIVTGLWRMEAWERDTLLYRVDFEVVPADALPGISSDCDLVS